ncbi:unnamed protein product [Mesocestoides corti]|uniref:Uncharacterized protein n=1 Tax=Mesocestoides corti TaxID=53468 RepID=A0A0R3UCR3_MESCO|nr:unnamed protein product [Mesocestoides corti]
MACYFHPSTETTPLQRPTTRDRAHSSGAAANTVTGFSTATPTTPRDQIHKTHRGFPPLFSEASNNRREADPPTQASASNGVGRFSGFEDSAAAFLHEVLRHRNSPSLLEQTGDVRAVLSAPFDLGRSTSRVCGSRLTTPGRRWCKQSTRSYETWVHECACTVVHSPLLSPRRLDAHCIPR